MIFIMAEEGAAPLAPAGTEEEKVAIAVWLNYGDVKIYQSAVIDAVALGCTYAMRIVANRTGGLRLIDMFVVKTKTALAGKNNAAVVTCVAEGIGFRTLRSHVCCLISFLEQKTMQRTVRTLSTIGVVCTMAVRAVNDTGAGVWIKQAWNVGIDC